MSVPTSSSKCPAFTMTIQSPTIPPHSDDQAQAYSQCHPQRHPKSLSFSLWEQSEQHIFDRVGKRLDDEHCTIELPNINFEYLVNGARQSEPQSSNEA
jgi:hypothetical protein